MNRRAFLAATGGALLLAGPARADGFADAFDGLQAKGRLGGIHGVVALRHGDILFERYMAGRDEAWGRPLGEVGFDPDTLHDLRSVTKSIVGLLYGIALDQGKVPAPGQPLMAQFPEYPDLAKDPARQGLTIAHALTMTLGTEWDETGPYNDARNSEIAMEMAKDRYRFVLDRPVIAPPGHGWIYSGGAVALLARLIEKGTGGKISAFARSALFEPLGIAKFEWAAGDDGVESAASGLRLTPRDLARVGQMVLMKGRWQGRAVVPPAWLEQSFRRAAMADDGRYYGYLWYVGEMSVIRRGGVYGEPWVGCFGLGGQRLFVFPNLDFVLAVTAGNYDKPDQWVAPIRILRDVFLPNLAV